jgi:hypothetical protein
VKDKAMLYAKTQCSKVEGGAVTATGTFAELIAPASTFREGFPVERAKTEFRVYKIQPIPSVTAGQTREVVSPHYSADDDAVYNEIARDRTPSEIEQKKDQLKQSVNQERDRRWPGTVTCDLAGDGSRIIPADARNDTDLRNIQAVTTTAQVVAGTPDAVLKFRDANDVTHNLSPEEVIALGLIVQAHVQSFYEKAWALKDSIDSMTSVELDAIDVRNNSHWGITNVSSSADSI